MNVALRFFLLLSTLLVAGCNVSKTLQDAAKNITLNTPEPIKVDMKITLDVYQHDGPDKTKKPDKAPDDLAELNRRKYNRQAEIQELKNARLVAETHQGLLILRDPPAGTYGNYVTETVDNENADRKALMIEDARKQKRELHQVEKERYEANVKNAYPGEWIEVPDPARPGGWIYAQKK